MRWLVLGGFNEAANGSERLELQANLIRFGLHRISMKTRRRLRYGTLITFQSGIRVLNRN